MILDSFFDANSKLEVDFCLHALVFGKFENSDSHENESMHTYIATVYVINLTLVSKSGVVQRTS